MLTPQEIRRRFLAYFREHGHEVVPSAPLIPPNDPSLLFTNSGMVQFKKCFTGEEDRGCHRACSAQKCLRVSGKHNDLENVGRTARHHTFFEMLGNFSFGDYFKKEAITWAWEFCTKELELPKEKLWVTVFREDDEAAELWQQIAGLPPERIVRMGEKDNFWTMGDTGPCGPCSEIYIDQGEDMTCGPDCGIGKCDCDRFLEIWNLVFTQFEQFEDGHRELLAKPNIDTGMGLERIAAVCQGKKSNFDTDLFQGIIQYAAELAGVTYSFSEPDTNDVDTALRVIADHIRSAAFLIAGGTLPSNESRGYVLRRLLRRALRFATLIGVHEPILYKVSAKVVEGMGDDYPELKEHADFIARVIHREEERFSLTLDKGLGLLEEEMERLKREGQSVIPGEFCFLLSDTYGFPLDIVTDVASRQGFSVDEEGFAKHMEEQRARAKESQKKMGLLGQGEDRSQKVFLQLVDDGIVSRFLGYDTLASTGRVVKLLDETGSAVEEIRTGGTGYMVATQTPFYGESGGQVGDVGEILDEDMEAEVATTLKPHPDLLVHVVSVKKGTLTLDREVFLRVDALRRKATARNHTATHLLHKALRDVLGSHVHQAGSLVAPDRLRFDFSHIQAVTPEELARIEGQVNEAILADCPVRTDIMSHDEAVASGAVALFDEKYGDMVRVLTIGDEEHEVSKELCGGTHLARSGEAGQFIIVSESGVAAGVRRIEAVTGLGALEYMRTQRETLARLSNALKSRPDQLEERVEALQGKVRKLEKASEKAQASSVSAADLVAKAEDIGGVSFVHAKIDQINVKALRALMDDVRSRLTRPSVAALFGQDEGKVAIIVLVSKELHERFDAPTLVRAVSPLCGGQGGGGRPDLAQAGGSDFAGVTNALDKLRSILKG